MSKQPNIMKERDIRRKQVLNIGDKVVVRKLCKQMQDKYEGKVGTIIEKVRLTIADDDIAYGLYFGRDDVVDKISFPLIGLPEKIGKTAVVAPFFAEDLVKVEDDKPKDEPRFDKIVIPVEADTFKPIKVTNKLLEEMGFKPTENFFRPANYILSREIIGFDVLVFYWDDKRESDTEWNVQITNAKDNLVLDADFTYLHELETYVYLATGEELIND